jgi:hypothetical protein
MPYSDETGTLISSKNTDEIPLERKYSEHGCEQPGDNADNDIEYDEKDAAYDERPSA